MPDEDQDLLDRLVPIDQAPPLAGPKPNPLEQWKLDNPNAGSPLMPMGTLTPPDPEAVAEWGQAVQGIQAPLNLAMKGVGKVARPVLGAAATALGFLPRLAAGETVPEALSKFPKEGEPIIPEIMPGEDEKGIVPSARRFAGGLLTPENLALAPFLPESKIVQGAFAIPPLLTIPHNIEDIANAQTPEERRGAITDFTLNAGLGGLIGHGLMKETPPFQRGPWTGRELETPEGAPRPPITQIEPEAPSAAPEPEAAKPTAQTDHFATEAEKPSFPYRNSFSIETGLAARSVADLNRLLEVRRAAQKRAEDILTKLEDPNSGLTPEEKAGLVQQRYFEGHKTQLASEAIQTATDTGGWIEGSITSGVPLNLGDRPLDVAQHPEAAEWIKANARELGLKPAEAEAEAEPNGPEATTEEQPGIGEQAPFDAGRAEQIRQYLAKQFADLKMRRMANRIMGRPPNFGLPKPASVFDRETALAGDDILSWLNSNDRLLSSRLAKKAWGKEKLKENSSQFEGEPDDLPEHHRKAIYSESGLAPNVIADQAYDAGKIKEPKEAALWDAIRKASLQRRGVIAATAREAEAIARKDKQLERWHSSTGEQTPDAPIPITKEELRVGDKLEVGGADIEVTKITDEAAELKNGHTFGTQELKPGEKIHVEKFNEGQEESLPESEAEFPEGVNTDFLPPGEEEPAPAGAGAFELKEEPPKPAGAAPAAQTEAAPAAAEPQPEPPKPPEPPHTGLGAAAAGETGGGFDKTGIYNAAVDERRKAMGLPEILKAAAQAIPEVFNRAMAMFDKDPDWPARLVKEVLEATTHRTFSPEEEMGLLRYEAELRTDYAHAARQIADDHDAGRTDAIPYLQAQVGEISDRLNDLDRALRKAGENWGRSGRFRQVMMKEDFSLASMEMQKRAARGGRQLSNTEWKELVKQAEGLQKAADELKVRNDDLTKQNREANERANWERVQKEAAQETVKKTEGARAYPDIVIKTAERIVKQLDVQGEAAKKRLLERTWRTSAGLDPTILSDLVLLGAQHLGHVGEDFVKWSDRMVADLGERVKPYLQQIWDTAKAHIDRIPEKGAAPDKVKKQIAKAVKDPEGRKPAEAKTEGEPKAQAPAAAPAAPKAKPVKTVDEMIEDQTAKIKTKVDKGLVNEIYPQVNKLARALYMQGVRDRGHMVEELRAILVKVIPDITIEETRDAFNGYGRFKPLSKEKIDVDIRQMKGESQQESKLRDILSKNPLLASGGERPKMGLEWRRLVKLVNEAKRKYGVVRTDPETQLASALDARKTYYRNQIIDLEAQIQKREKFIKQRSPSPTDAELQRLQKRRDELKAQFDQIFPKEPISDAERLRRAIEGAKKNQVEWLERLADAMKGNYDGPEGRKPITGPELELVKAKTEAIKAEIEHLKSIDEAFQERTRGEALKDAIGEYERRLKAGDFSTPEAPEKAVSKKLQKLIDRRNELRSALARARAAGPEAMAEALRVAQAYGDELQRRINEGDIEARGKSATAPTTPELEAQRAENAEMQTILGRLRNAAKPKASPDEIALKQLKARITNRIAEYQQRLADQDFAPRPRKAALVSQDPELIRLKIQEAGLKRAFREGLVRDRLAQRKGWEVLADKLVRYRRGFALTGITTIGKLLDAAVIRLGTNFTEEAIGGAIGKLIPQVADKATYEGGFKPSIEAQAITKGFMNGLREYKDVLRTGRGGLDALYGKQRDVSMGETSPVDQAWIDFFGHLHAVIKNPVKTSAFERAFQKGLEWYGAHGVDVTDDLVQLRVAAEAYEHAQRSVFLQDNRIVNTWRGILRVLEGSDKAGGLLDEDVTRRPPPPGYKALGTGARLLVPIVRIPTNIAFEVGQYSGIGVASGLVRLGLAMRRGLDTLQPAEADAIMRDFKKGSIGTAALLAGFMMPQVFGGYYQPGQKRPRGDVKAMAIRIGGHDIPSWLAHNPLIETFQVGATIRRVMEAKLKRGGQQQGLSGGLMAAALGLTDQIPFVHAMLGLNKLYEPNTRQRFLGEGLRNLAVPVGVQNAAEWSDRANGKQLQRKPQDMMGYVKEGIPGLRQTLPRDYRRESRE